MFYYTFLIFQAALPVYQKTFYARPRVISIYFYNEIPMARERQHGAAMRPDLMMDLFKKEKDYWWNRSKREMVLSLVREMATNQQPRMRGLAVDIGCGTGYTAMALESDWRTVGIDISREALHFCQGRGLKRLCQSDCDFLSLPFKTGTFDLILALDVIEHVEDDVGALAECSRILKAGGLLIATVPAFMALWSPWDEALGHQRRYTTSTLSQKIQQAGLSIRKMTYMFFFIFPIVVLIRGVKRLFQRDAASYSSDFIPLPKMLNHLLIQIGRLERWIITKVKLTLPFGVSVVSVATKI